MDNQNTGGCGKKGAPPFGYSPDNNGGQLAFPMARVLSLNPTRYFKDFRCVRNVCRPQRGRNSFTHRLDTINQTVELFMEILHSGNESGGYKGVLTGKEMSQIDKE